MTPNSLPSQEGSPLDVDAVARGLAELEFDARVALPEAQERFKRAELERDQAIEIRENANALSVRVEAENRRLREELELAVAVGRLAGIEADRYRAALERIAYPPNFISSRSTLSEIARKALSA